VNVVKKMILLVGGFAAIIAGVAGSTYLFASTPGTVQAQQQGTKVAVINIGKVFSEYSRAKTFKTDLEETLKPYKDKAKKLTDQIKEWEDALRTTGKVDPKNREQFENAIKQNRRELEDMSVRVQNDLGKRQEANLMTLWKEVDMAIGAVAKAQGYHIVLGYGDPVEKDMMNLFPNINRKMQAMDMGSTLPLYVDPANDISYTVVFNLNEWAKKGVQQTSGQK
jgi:Skp family chaperone for outer membrane proteins